jgi:drug/metabolite transporter (DMT)-like permease
VPTTGPAAAPGAPISVPEIRPMMVGDWALLAFLAALWSSSYVLVALAVHDVPPLTLVFVRATLAAILLWGWARASGVRFPTSPRTWGALTFLGFLNCALPFWLLFWGQQHIASSLAGILISTGPLLTIICAHFLTRDERLNGRKAIGVCCGLVGTAVLIGVDALRDFNVESLAEIAVIGAALCYALAAVLSRQFAGQPPIVTAVGQLAAGGLMALPVALAIDRPWTLPAPSVAGLGATMALTLFCTAVAYVGFFRVLHRAGASNAMLVSFLTPIGASIIGVVVLGERLAAHNLAGMALIFAGLAVLDGRVLGVARRAVA